MHRFVQVLSADVLAKLLLGLVAIALIRYMSVDAYAQYTLAVAVATAAAQLLAAGFNRIYIIGHERLDLDGREATFLGVQVAGVAALAALGSLFASAFNGLYPLVALLAMAIVGSEFAKSYFQQALRFGTYSAVEVGRSLLQAGAIVGLIVALRAELGAGPVLAAQAIALLAALGLALAAPLDWTKFFDLRSGAAIVRGILAGPYATLAAYFAVIAVFAQIDVFMLKTLADDATLAAYGAAFRYYSLLSLALGAVHAVLLPAIQRSTTPAELDALYAQHFRLLALFAPAVLVVAWLAGWVLPWIDRGRYPEAVPAFRVLAVSSIVSFAFSPHVNLLMKLERFRFLLCLVAVAFVAAVGLHAALIPRFGALGAAVATLAASAMVTMPIFFTARRLKAAGRIALER